MSRTIQVRNNLIVELWDNERIWDESDMCFPSGRGTADYRVGDFMFIQTLKRRYAARIYREFDDNSDDELSLARFLIHFMELDEVKIVWKLDEISSSGVKMSPYMMYSNRELVGLTWRNGQTQRTWTRRSFEDFFIRFRHHTAATIWIPIGRAVLEAATLPFTGFAGAAARRLAGPIMRRYRRRAMRYVLVRIARRWMARVIIRVGAVMVNILVSVARETATSATRAYLQTRSDNNDRQTRGRSQVNINLDGIVNTAFRNAIAAQIPSIVFGELNDIVHPRITRMIVPSSFRNSLVDAVMAKLSGTLVGEFTVVAQTVLSNAMTQSNQSQQGLSTRIHTQLSQQFTTSARVSRVTGEVNGGVSDAIRQAFTFEM